MSEPKLVTTYTHNGHTYNVYYFGISYRCPELKIFGERSELSCINSIKRKLKKASKSCT